MKTIKKHLKVVALFFSVLILLQGCTVYKSTPITLEKAVQNESKVRITTNTNKTFVYKKIVVDDGNYYGIEKIKGKKINIPINLDLVKSINEKNKTLSTALSIGIPIVITVGILFIASDDIDMGWTP